MRAWAQAPMAGSSAGKRIATVCERLPETLAPERSRATATASRTSARSTTALARAEHLLMNLRLSEGIDLAAYRARWGVVPAPETLAALAAGGFVKLESGRLSATPRGMLVLNRVIEELAV